MTEKTYNGWTNYETWVVKLWMDNEEDSYRGGCAMAQEAWDEAEATGDWTREQAALFALEDRLKADYEEAKDIILDNAKISSSVWADLLGAALSEVNWREIATAMLDDVDITEAAAETSDE